MLAYLVETHVNVSSIHKVLRYDQLLTYQAWTFTGQVFATSAIAVIKHEQEIDKYIAWDFKQCNTEIAATVLTVPLPFRND